jgi:ATP-dependent RNA circularization protein (DNA/RNA ligase family)
MERLKFLNVFGFHLKYMKIKNIEIVKTAYSTEEKRELFNRLKKENKEGIVFKNKRRTQI